jgi:aminopeptidase N
VPELTEAEAAERAALIDVESYELVLDLTTDPVTSRTEVRFGSRGPDGQTFADVRLATVREAVLNGERLPGPVDGRLSLRGLRPAGNVLTVEGDVTMLSWFTDPADGGRYVHASTFPDYTPELMACFDQPGILAPITLSLRAPADWECFSSGEIRQRPAAGEPGWWRFATVPGLVTVLLTFAAGPYAQGADGVARRRSLPPAAAQFVAQFAATAARAREHYERVLGVPFPDRKYEIVFVPGLFALARAQPGLMLVNETLLARMADPDDGLAAGVCMHEVAHAWFGCLVTPRWWDDLWLDEAMADYLSNGIDPVERTAFAYAKSLAYRADELPGSEAVASPVADSAHAVDRPAALTYLKGASLIHQVAALIGDDALNAGLNDYLTRFAGRAGTLDDMVACWSSASGRDLAGWADQWLRSPGAPVLRPSMRVGPDGVIESFSVVQDRPRMHLIKVGLYDLATDGRLKRRGDLVAAELSGDRTPVPELAGQPLPDAIVLNDGDLSYTRTRFDDVSLRVLTSAAMQLDDPLTEAVGWNAAWDMVTSAELPAATLAATIARRLRAGGQPPRIVERLTERAIACAQTWAPPGLRAALREQIAAACIYAEQAVVHRPVRGPLAAGFATAAQTEDQLAVLRSWLQGDLDAELRAKATFTLAARGLATDGDLNALFMLDPVNGESNCATAGAMRPDPAAKEAAWQAALCADWQLARAHASGIWVPGQEELMTGYRDRYFTEALPALARSELGRRQRMMLTRLLFPATLVSPATIEACAGFEDNVVVAEQAAVMRQVEAARRLH